MPNAQKASLHSLLALQLVPLTIAYFALKSAGIGKAFVVLLCAAAAILLLIFYAATLTYVSVRRHTTKSATISKFAISTSVIIFLWVCLNWATN